MSALRLRAFTVKHGLEWEDERRLVLGTMDLHGWEPKRCLVVGLHCGCVVIWHEHGNDPTERMLPAEIARECRETIGKPVVH